MYTEIPTQKEFPSTAAESRAALLEASFVDLVTYRRDGRPVSTPMLSVPHDGKILLRTHHTAGKLKRLRSNSAVELAPLGRHRRRVGIGISGNASILPGEATAECLDLLHRRHGLLGRAATWLRHLHGHDVFIEVRLDAKQDAELDAASNQQLEGRLTAAKQADLRPSAEPPSAAPTGRRTLRHRNETPA